MTETKTSLRHIEDLTNALLRLQTVNNIKPHILKNQEKSTGIQSHGFNQSGLLWRAAENVLSAWRRRGLLQKNVEYYTREPHTHELHTVAPTRVLQLRCQCCVFGPYASNFSLHPHKHTNKAVSNTHCASFYKAIE